MIKTTPETDAFAIKFKTLCGEKYWVPVDIARKLERERDEAREEAAHWKSEWEIVESRLCGWKHPRDNGIIFEHEVIPVLRKELDDAREDSDQWKDCATKLVESSGWHDLWPQAVAHYRKLKEELK